MAARFCSSCGAVLALGASFCAACGAPAQATAGAPGPAWSTAPAPAAPAAAAVAAAPRVSQGMAIAALILNLIVWPGLGSLVAGRRVGWAQGFLFLAGIPLALILIGIPMLVGAWIWGLVTGIQLIQEADRPPG